MIPIKKVFNTTTGQKYLMALTGVALVLFIIVHLLGNLQLLVPGEAGQILFNKYGAKFKSLGPFFYVLEWGLFALFAVHAVLGAALWRRSAEARGSRYAMAQTKGGASRWNLSSRHMMVVGLVLLIFTVVHVLQFRYETPGLIPDKEYKTELAGHEEPVVDLHSMVVDTFQNPFWVAFYMGAMIFLGFHLRHGIWSMFQSLGAMPTPYSDLLYVAGGVVAVVLALGFLILPLYLFIVFP